MRPQDQITHQYADPRVPKTHGQPVAIVSWTDAGGGQHQLSVSSPVTVGTSAAAQIVLADPTVSSVHLELAPGAEGVTVRDLRSTNGTYTETMRLYLATLRGDFRLWLGRAEILVRQPGTHIEAPLWNSSKFGNLLGGSVPMRSLYEQLANVARSDETVLLQGETGTGKELVAAAIHERSPRAGKPYIVVDCSVLHPDLAESELFGHARGAFSGATRDREGAFEAADGGTLFLDEIGELPLEMQAKLLRALESRHVRRVGETEYRNVDVRVIAASFRDLRELVNQRAFREDLYYRLAVVPLRVPPLRDRLADIPMLVEHFVSRRPGAVMPSDEVMRRLLEHTWMGNVRELRNLVGRASVQGWEVAIADGIGADVSGEAPSVRGSVDAGAGDDLSAIGGTYYEARRRWTEKGERAYVEWVMQRSNQSIVRAAALAGVDVSTLRKIVRRLKGQ